MTRAARWSTFPLTPLRRLALVQSSNVDKVVEENERAVQLCNYVDVYYNERITGGIPFSTGSALPREIAKFSLRGGDVIITKDSETPEDIAVPALVDRTAAGVVCGYHLAMLRPDPHRMRGDFLFWTLKARPVKDSFSVRAQGITRYGLTLNGIGSVFIPTPDLPTQKAIADFLDRETARLDALIAKKQRLSELLENSRVVTIIRAVTGQGNEPKFSSRTVCSRLAPNSPFPHSLDGWTKTRLRYCVDSTKNGAWGSDEGTDEKDIICLRVADFAWDRLAISLNKLTVRSITHEQFRRLALRPGDILLEKSGGGEKTPVGRVVRFDGGIEAITSNFVARVRPKPIVDSRYLIFLLAGLYMSGYSHQFIKQNTGIQNLDDAALFASPVLIPNQSEQRRIVDFLGQEAMRVDSLQERIRCSVERLRELRSALITAAVTGQIDVVTWGKQGETDRRLDAIQHDLEAERGEVAV